jgi:hypothetical protein
MQLWCFKLCQATTTNVRNIVIWFEEGTNGSGSRYSSQNPTETTMNHHISSNIIVIIIIISQMCSRFRRITQGHQALTFHNHDNSRASLAPIDRYFPVFLLQKVRQ